VRLDKLSLAALGATLRSFLDPENAWHDIPVLAMLARTEDELQASAELLAAELVAGSSGRLTAEVVVAQAAVGGGALPLAGLATRAVAVQVTGLTPDRLERRLRQGVPPILVRIQNDRVLFDLRTISPAERAALPDLVARAIGS
jgi:L-seryl-tRNA(Ser) seleniumtransferase